MQESGGLNSDLLRAAAAADAIFPSVFAQNRRRHHVDRFEPKNRGMISVRSLSLTLGRSDDIYHNTQQDRRGQCRSLISRKNKCSSSPPDGRFTCAIDRSTMRSTCSVSLPAAACKQADQSDLGPAFLSGGYISRLIAGQISEAANCAHEKKINPTWGLFAYRS